MIVLPVQRLLIITPPKTASTSLHQVLCGGGAGGEDFGGIWVNGLSMAGRSVDHHLVGYAPGFRIFMTVRHPLDRLVSLYKHQARYDVSEGRACEAFWCFCNRIGRSEHPDMLYQWNQCKYLEGFVRRDSTGQFPDIGAFPPERAHAPYAIGVQLSDERIEVLPIHVERLVDELAAEGIHVPHIGWLNSSGMANSKPWEFFYGEGKQRESLLAVIEPWARPDCERFGYPWPAGKDSPAAAAKPV